MIIQLKDGLTLSNAGFIFDTRTRKSFTINPLGLEIIRMLKKGISIHVIKHEITKEHLLDGDSFKKDFDSLISMLKKHKLLLQLEEEKFDISG